MNANIMGARGGLRAPWAEINNVGGAVLNVKARSAGNPDVDAIKVWADSGADATVALRAAQGSKNNPGITFDRANTASWRVGIN